MSTNKKQWSDRIRDNFQDQGIPWSPSLERQVKAVVAAAAASVALDSLNEHRRGPIDALVSQLEERLPMSNSLLNWFPRQQQLRGERSGYRMHVPSLVNSKRNTS